MVEGEDEENRREGKWERKKNEKEEKWKEEHYKSFWNYQ